MATVLDNPETFATAAPRRHQLLIGGRWTAAVHARFYPLLNPSNGEILAEVADAGPEDIDKAVAAAEAVSQASGWSDMGAIERGRLLWQLGDRLLERIDELSELEAANSGRPLSVTRTIDVPLAAQFFQVLSSWCTMRDGAFDNQGGDTFIGGVTTDCTAAGVTALIGSRDLPLLSAAARIAPLLAAGGSAVFLADRDAPLSAICLAEIGQEAGLPDGILNLVTSAHDGLDEHLLARPAVRGVEYIGEADRAVRLARAAANRLLSAHAHATPSRAEIVYADADLEQAACGVTDSLMLANDQGVSMAGELLVERTVFKQVIDRISELISALEVGGALAPGSQLGPLLSAADAERLENYLELLIAEGLEVQRPAQHLPPRGFHAAPALVVNADGVDRGICGPVANRVLWITPFDRTGRNATWSARRPRIESLGLWTRDRAVMDRCRARYRGRSLRFNYVPEDDSRALTAFYTHYRYGERQLIEAARSHRRARIVLSGATDLS